MVKYLIARQLSGKKVITNDGDYFGRLVDLNINETTGKIEDLIIEPNPDKEIKGVRKNIEGEILVSYDAVIAVGDFIILDKRKI